jgi:hypothetical protein
LDPHPNPLIFHFCTLLFVALPGLPNIVLQRLHPAFFDYSLSFLRQDLLPIKIRVEMSELFPILARKRLNLRTMKSFLLYFRAILQDIRLHFACIDCLEALEGLCCSTVRTKKIFEDFEFHSELNHCISDLNVEIVECALGLILSYLKLEASRVPLNFAGIVCLCRKSNDSLALIALKVIQQSIVSGALHDLEEFHVWELFKELMADGSFFCENGGDEGCGCDSEVGIF